MAARDGITGHLDERDPVFEHGWKGYGFKSFGAQPDGTGWPLEQCAYWLDGAMRLALVLHDEPLLKKIRARLDPIVDGVHKSRTTLIYWKDRKAVDARVPEPGFESDVFFNSWAHSHLARALLAYYQGTGQRRVLEALQIAYSNYPLPESMNHTGGVPSEVNLDPMLDLYRLTGESRLLEQAVALASQPFFRKRFVDYWKAKSDLARCNHGVCFIERGRVPGLLYPWTGEPWMRDASLDALDWAEQRHMLPCGVPSSEEFFAGKGAFRCIETCDVPCWIWSQLSLFRVVGQARFADKVESAFFNAGPAPIARDWQTMSYYQSPNRMSAKLPGAEPRAPDPGSFRFKPTSVPLCCVGNVNRLIPNYVIHMWMATPDHGLAATLYGPCVVSARSGDNVPVTLTCQTTYPFEEEVNITVEPARASRFPLYFRVPQWCERPQIKVGEAWEALRPGDNGFAKISRDWNRGDVVSLRFPMPVRIVRGRETPYPQHGYFKRVGCKQTEVNNPYASVYAGPLLFALPIPDKDANTAIEGTDWRYALDCDGSNADEMQVQRRPMPAKWSWQLDAPVTVSLPAARFDWQPTDEQPLPKAPVTGEASKMIRLVPYGCAKFRVSMFPVTARAWPAD